MSNSRTLFNNSNFFFEKTKQCSVVVIDTQSRLCSCMSNVMQHDEFEKEPCVVSEFISTNFLSTTD